MIRLICIFVFAIFALHANTKIVIFGITGDLTERKLLPALIQLEKENKLPQDFQVIGIGRKDKQFSYPLTYIRGDNADPETYEKIGELIRTNDDVLYFLATPPSNFATIIKQLSEQGLLDTKAKVIIEKPFGHDLESAIQLNKEISKYLAADQTFLIDHYLGKELVKEIQDHKRNEIWNKDKIDSVYLTISEDLGMEGRGAYWEETGLLRDMIENHVMQLMAIIGMTKDKLQVFKDIKIDSIMRGQYGPGQIHGKDVVGYRQEPGVNPQSNVETFVAAKFYIDNAEWKGVPFYIKVGKRLSSKYTEILVNFKDHTLQLRDSPNNAYAVLIDEALKGDHSHFASVDEHLSAWKLLTPILQDWSKNPPQDFPNYKSGSEGPTIPWR